MRNRVVAAVAAALLFVPVLAGPADAAPAAPTAADHLNEIVARSKGPEYRRFGSPGMERVAGYLDSQLSKSGYSVAHVDFGLPRWAVDYAPPHAPSLVRVVDGKPFKTESAFYLGKTTGPDGITCVVRKINDVKPGDCGWVPFGDASPEWKNDPFVKLSADAAAVAKQGGVGLVVQGDTARNAVYAVSMRTAAPLPTVVSVADENDVVGQPVRLRAMGALEPATGHDVLGVRRPGAPAKYVLLLGHADGWFQAAADNGGGAAAVLRAAQLIAGEKLPVGVIAAEMDAEEVGLVGSKRLTEALSTTGVDVGDGGPPVCMGDLAAVINLDASSARASDAQALPRQVLGTDAPLFSWRAFVFSDQSPLGPAFMARAAQHQVLGAPAPASAWKQAVGSWRTDAGWFDDAGVPVAWPVVGYPEYHTDVDDGRVVDPVDLEHVAEAAAATVADVPNLPLGDSKAKKCASVAPAASSTPATVKASAQERGAVVRDPGDGGRGRLAATGGPSNLLALGWMALAVAWCGWRWRRLGVFGSA